MGETGRTAVDETEVGSYFVANYPPFSVWTADAVERDALPALSSPPAPVPLGLYLHVPFCRKRCHFCYFRVYTDKNAQEVEEYLDVMAREWEIYNTYPAINGRPLNFVYFGGGTPSFLSVRQLTGLVQRLTAVTPWTSAEEITFECEPGTLTEPQARGHSRPRRDAAQPRHRELRRSHPRGERPRAPIGGDLPRLRVRAVARAFRRSTSISSRACSARPRRTGSAAFEKTIELAPDSVTIYQMELPFNTTISSDVLKGTGRFQEHVASWSTKRRWVDEAFDALQKAGYTVGSAYTAVRESRADEVHLSRSAVAGRRSRGSRRGVVRPHQRRAHAEPRQVGDLQREDSRGRAAAEPRVPARSGRAAHPRARAAAEARARPPVVLRRRNTASTSCSGSKSRCARWTRAGFSPRPDRDVVSLTRAGLLRVDSLLPRFFQPKHAGIRYT